ncbi:glycosyltransferase family 39 protein [Thermodesulfobacteriota bacterium]
MNKKKKKRVPEKPGITDRFAYFIDSYSYQLLIAILSLALVLRLLALLSLKESIYFDFLLWDERLYHSWAEKIANGTFQSSSVYEMAPLPAYFMAFIYRLFSPDIIYIRIVNIILGVLTCYLIYLIGKELANRSIGLLACLLACLYKPFIFYSIVPLKTSLSVFLFASTCYLLIALLGKTSMIKVLLLGIAIGLVNNVRPNCLVLVPIILVFLIWNAYRERYSFKIFTATIVLYVAGLVIVQSPFMIRNYMVAGETSTTPSQSGFNLFMCNNLQYGYPVPFASTAPAEMGIQFTIEASRRVGKKFSPREASQYWTNEVVRMAMERPGAFTMKQAKKLFSFFNWFERGDHYHIGFISDYVKLFKFPFLGLWLILPFGMTGMILNMFRSRKSFALSVIFIIYALTLVAFFTNIRVRLPLLVILIPFAILGLRDLRIYIKGGQSKRAIIYSVILLVFVVVEFLPVRDTKDMTAYLNTHAIILNSKGVEHEATQYWEKSSKLEKHYSAFANISLAGKYYSMGDIRKALDYLNKISDDSFAASQKYDMIGDMMVRLKQPDRAVKAYEKSLEINSGLRNTRLKLVRILWKIDKQKALEENDKFEYINSFYNLYGAKRKRG